MKTLSIIIPHFNSTDKLATLLESIPSKDWIEVIVIDDHSNELSKRQLKGLMALYPDYSCLTVPQNEKGPGIARNIGIEASAAKWLLFADSDDFFTEHAFSIIEPYLSTDNEVVYFVPDSLNVTTNASCERHKQYKNLILQYKKDADKTLFYRFFVPWSKLVSRSLVQEHNIKFDDGVGGEDNNFSLKVAYYSQKIDSDESVIYCVTESDSSLTRQFSEKVLENHFLALSRYNDFLQEKDLAELQVPMLGWVVRARNISLMTMLNWFLLCLKKGYPISPLHYIRR